MLKTKKLLIWAAGLLPLLGTAQAAPTPAGTAIENRAYLDYQDAPDAPITTLTSPPVVTTISAQCSASVLPDGSVAAPGQVQNVLPGEGGAFRYTLTNTGNTESTFELGWLLEAASDFGPQERALYLDMGSGQVLSSQTPIQTVQLAPNQTASLLATYRSAATQSGAAYLNMVAACPGSQGGASDSNNVAKVQLGTPPAFTLTKTFNRAVVAPSGEVVVSITASNTGAGASREVTVTDMLNTPDMADFRFVPGSASSEAGTLEYSDGAAWAATEGGNVRGVRVRLSSLAPGQSVGLSFRLLAPAGAVGRRTNAVTLLSGGLSLSADAALRVNYTPIIALGPVNNPEASPGGELSADDSQSKAVAVLGREVCFDHTLKNLGDVTDQISVSGQVTAGSADIKFYQKPAQPVPSAVADPLLTQPMTLVPGQSYTFQVCYTPHSAASSDALRVLLTATSAQGAVKNQTVDVVRAVITELPKLIKTVLPSGTLTPGQTVTYTLSLSNPLSIALSNVVVSDTLDSHLDFISADSGGALQNAAGGPIVWTIHSIAPGATLTFTVLARVKADTPDDTVLSNKFSMVSSELPAQESNTVQSPVYSGGLTFVKLSNPTEVAIGDNITYTLRVTNPSKVATLRRVELTDDMPVGIEYVPGSSRLDGAPIDDPAVQNRKYTWVVSNLAPRQSAEITFLAKVTPDVNGQVSNTAIANAVSNAGATVGSPSAVASTRVRALIFEPVGDIVGYVFIDLNRNGTYDLGKDLPMERARVLLANGRVAVTDAAGRYHFDRVQEGFWALRLDPASVYAQNITVPQDGALSGSRGVNVRNLSSVDFALAPLAGDIGVIRDTTLSMGNLQVRKQVHTTSAGVYQVSLTLQSSAALPGFTLSDPLPPGATLLSGQHLLTFDPLPAGSRTVTYRFGFTGEPNAAVTDPTAQWRY